ncbi:hypothetical protein [Streptomyces jumonjinensis]|uniref:Calcium-binding protein n=1 Tax=Streptomyces jumonjinensis TaxID=1945 RepID=A0A646KAD5_STRJU|nr:hypothetical protein [Streptomyces jumonjinensis]MQS99087.1 hypothetical protein [Streptomyces jumonjinensis]
MRMRTTAAAVTGVLALTAFAVPVAHADDQPAAVAARAGKLTAQDNGSISNLVVNGGKPVVVGVSAAKSFTVSFTAKDPDGVEDLFVQLWRKGTYEDPKYAFFTDETFINCGSGTSVTCKAKFVIEPGWLYKEHDAAGSYNTSVTIYDTGFGFDTETAKNNFKLQRAAKLTADASPESVEKDSTLTVTGALTRANWESYTYKGYADQKVDLQFRKSGADKYTTVKTVKADSKGRLKTTVKASSDGHYRYSFAGSTTTQAVNAKGDGIDVR